MERSRLLHTIWCLVQATAVVSAPAEATTVLDTGAAQAPVSEVLHTLIDYFSQKVLLGGLVLLALVLIARAPRAR